MKQTYWVLITGAVTLTAILFMGLPTQAQLFGFGRPVAASKLSDRAMEEARQNIAEKMPLEFADGRLTYKFPSADDVDTVCGNILGESHNTSRSDSGDTYHCQYESDVARLIVSSGRKPWGQDSDDVKTVSLQDLTDPSNRVEIKIDDVSGKLSLFSIDLAKQKINIFRQTKTSVILVTADGDQFVSMAGDSVNQLVREPGFVAALNQFRDAGIGMPKIASTTKIETWIESILNFSDQDRQKFEAAFPDLASRQFKLRKQAAKALSQDIAPHAIAIAAMLVSDDLPLEMRARILEAVNNSDDEEAVLMITTFAKEKLNNSPALLVSLLTRQIDASAAPEIIAKTVVQLEKVTDQKFGNDVVAWKKWTDDHVVSATSAPGGQSGSDSTQADSVSQTDPSDAVETKTAGRRKSPRRLRKTGLQQVQNPLKDLLKLKHHADGHMVIDREHWMTACGGKPIRVMLKDAKRDFENSGLPKSWLQLGGEHSVAGIGHEQIIFDRIADNVHDRSHGHDHFSNYEETKTRSLNRSMDKSNLKMRLMVHEEGRRWEDVRRNRAFFKFLFEDEVEDLFYLISEEPDQGLAIFVFKDGGKKVLNFRCDKKGKVILHHVAAGKPTSIAADSIEQLLKQHQPFINQIIVPLLDSVGISAEAVF